MSFRGYVCLAALGMSVGMPLFLAAQDNATNQTTASRELAVTVGKSVLVDSPQTIERVAVSNGDLAEAVVISPHEIMVNGRAAGETSLIILQQGRHRPGFDLAVQRNGARID